MNNKLFVGGLAYAATEEDLKNFFASCGNITSAKIITDRDTGRSRGFAFVEFETEEAAQEGLKLDGQNLAGRPVKLSLARPQEPRAPRENNW